MRQPTDPQRLAELMRRLGGAAKGPATIYLTGGATALLLGFRSATIDVDLKIERGHARDREDVRALLTSGAVERSRLRELFEAIVPELFRFPALDEVVFRRALERALADEAPAES